MRRPAEDNAEASRIMLGLLEAVEHDRAQSQRHLASELGIALGLVNAYLKRCVKKGLVKIGEAPARRYAYYLTPKGFAEKSRLTVEYLSYSFSFFRQAKTDCSALLQTAKARGLARSCWSGGPIWPKLPHCARSSKGSRSSGWCRTVPARISSLACPSSRTLTQSRRRSIPSW